MDVIQRAAAQELANEVRHRIWFLCLQAGFAVPFHGILQNAVIAYVYEPRWNPPPQNPRENVLYWWMVMAQMQVHASICSADCTYDGQVSVYCEATTCRNRTTPEKLRDREAPLLLDCQVPLEQLPRLLHRVAYQMWEIISDRSYGKPGPWHFDELRWGKLKAAARCPGSTDPRDVAPTKRG